MIGKKALLKLLANMPSKIRVNRNTEYEIVFIDSFENIKQLGEMRPDIKQIVIKRGQSPTETLKTLLHECFHAISDENDINLTETQVGKLEDAVWRFFNLNKVLDQFK